EPRDKTWRIGDDIISLLDLYTLWALRHLHLVEFGRWPGHQSVSHPYEMLDELQGNEYCGCDRSEKLYADCCKQTDLKRDRAADALDFLVRHTNGGVRQPPDSVVTFVQGRGERPRIMDLLTPARV